MSPRPALSAACARIATGAALVCALAVAAAASDSSPTAQVKEAVDQALHVLQDPVLKTEPKQAERRRILRTIADGLFDFEEMSRRAMSAHWRPLSEDQRREFVRLFSEVLERAYMSKIESYNGEKIRYTGERIEGDTATVSTRIVTKEGIEIPIDYRLLTRNGRWLAYDVSIEGVSLVANYRTQFNSVIRTSSYDELLRRLRSRAEAPTASR